MFSARNETEEGGKKRKEVKQKKKNNKEGKIRESEIIKESKDCRNFLFIFITGCFYDGYPPVYFALLVSLLLGLCVFTTGIYPDAFSLSFFFFANGRGTEVLL